MLLRLLIVILISHQVYGISSVRQEGEDYRAALDRHASALNRNNTKGSSAYEVAQKWKDYSWDDATTEWASFDEIRKAFIRIRDARFIKAEYDNKPFPRRSSWLFPDDGCWVRADLAKYNLRRWGYSNIYKIYIFGNLEVDTPNSRYGKVNWWYHVAPAALYKDTLYILDPAINPDHPVEFKDWVTTMKDKNALVALCHGDTHDPLSECSNPQEVAVETSLGYQQWFLDFEWQNLLYLGRDPLEELGDNPPWL